ncbi:Peptidase M20 domain-containing protein 2 [Fusarium keratoplasticum]|uniref:Peptidase M20 domain-containing protein 2 n=1 Tax=Fusarium keratoplasticum TaxID=1328300 RepID=A0ACC0QHP3_9HYPO|nr:Peptidase M20 domain-containing protein 2 [Fusarium keratoplasticum]KAI8652323.1 Peptidase M20 domain-containing protein 2 [Fusarium keratoplasticum]KAI8653063.1 Peptidase M20 domain-containing protein 2 [Fusarium keratoplasticum]
MMILSTEQIYDTISKSVDTHTDDLASICKKIHENPEYNFQEFQAHDNICDLLQNLDFKVTRHAYGLETSFEVECGQGGKLVVFNAEYDALPGLGHACGHNLIATSSIAAFLATAEVLRHGKLKGRVRLLGTPAEEGGGGKIRLIEAGAYQGVDACLMAHPTGRLSPEGTKRVDGISAAKSSARRQLEVTFKGQNAHAGMSPWHGKNALDAVVSSYVNISLLRQQLPPSARVHGVIRSGGAEPNIIPDTTSLEYYLRESTVESIQDLSRKVEACFKAGAVGTGCTLECDWHSDKDYMELCPNTAISTEFTRHMKAFGREYLEDSGKPPMGASTDMGNVTFLVPGIHPMFSIGIEDPLIQPHTPEFAAAAGTKEALESALDCGKGLAATACEILLGPELSTKAWEEFHRDVEPIIDRL